MDEYLSGQASQAIEVGFERNRKLSQIRPRTLIEQVRDEIVQLEKQIEVKKELHSMLLKNPDFEKMFNLMSGRY